MTEQHRQKRRGKFTASEIYKLMSVKGFGETGNTYILEKVNEELGVYNEEISSKAIDHGKQYEPYALLHYGKAFNIELYKEEFITSNFTEYCGCSPDALIQNLKIGLEVKFPYASVHHTKHMLIKNNEQLKKTCKEYYYQIQLCLLITGFENWEFVSYDPRFNDNLKMYVLNILPDFKEHEFMKERILEAVKLKNDYLNQIL